MRGGMHGGMNGGMHVGIHGGMYVGMHGGMRGGMHSVWHGGMPSVMAMAGAVDLSRERGGRVEPLEAPEDHRQQRTPLDAAGREGE